MPSESKSFDWTSAGVLPMLDESDPMVMFYLDAAQKWLATNTSFVFVAGEDLPSGVKAFLVKYCEVAAQGGSVQSESIGGMSQTFKNESMASLLREWAQILLPEYYNSGKFIAAKRRCC